MEFREKKKILREETLAKRDSLSKDEREEMSTSACCHGKAVIQFEPGANISGFFPIRSEIDPRSLMDALAKRGARICLPVVLDRETICFRELVPGMKLVNTGFGTKGPPEDAAVLDPQILIMPMSVFDKQGGRIGYGAGHYDRAIARLIDKGIKLQLIGMAFDCQRIDSVPVEAHDQPLNAVITESGYWPVESA